MALTIKFGTMTKRINSTYQNMTEQLTCDVILKNNTSVVNPVFIVHCPGKDADALLKCNYCNGLQAGLHRYYWIDDIVFTSGNNSGGSNIFEVYCHVDVLASMYDFVKNETHFVKYTGDIKNADLQIDDERLSPEIPLNAGPTTLLEVTPFGSGWTYIIKVKVLTNGAGASILYAVDKTNFDKLMNDWLTKSGLDTAFTDVKALLDALCNKLGGISNNVSDFLEDWWLIWINPSQFGSMTDTVQMGTWNTDAKGKMLGYSDVVIKGNYVKTISIPSPIPSQTAANQMHFLKSKKYTQLMLKSSSGTSDISTDSFVLSNSEMKVQIKYILGLITGECVFEIWDKNTSSFLGSTTANLKLCPITNIINGGGTDDANMKALGSVGRLAIQLGATASAVNTASFQSQISSWSDMSNADKSFLIGATQRRQNSINKVADLSSGIIGSLGSTPRSGSMGGGSFSGSISGLLMQMMNLANDSYTYNAFVTVIGYFNIPAVCTDINSYNAYAVEHGYPCSKMIKLADLANNTYLQCSMADVLSASASDVGFTPREVCEFNNFLNTGIFIDASTGKKGELDPEEARKHLPGVISDVAEKASLINSP